MQWYICSISNCIPPSALQAQLGLSTSITQLPYSRALCALMEALYLKQYVAWCCEQTLFVPVLIRAADRSLTGPLVTSPSWPLKGPIMLSVCQSVSLHVHQLHSVNLSLTAVSLFMHYSLTGYHSFLVLNVCCMHRDKDDSSLTK